MHIEVQVALNFVISYLYNKLPRRRVNIFGEELEKALKDKFQGHWYPDKPFKGSAFRCLKTGDPVDSVLERAARESGLSIHDILENLPAELSVWVDPGEVSYRIGEKATVKVLYTENNDNPEDISSADCEVNKTFNPEAQCFRPIDIVNCGMNGLSLSPKTQSSYSGSSPLSASSISPTYKGSPNPPAGGGNGGAYLLRNQAPLTFTTATFAQTKFGSTKLKTNSKRPNNSYRMSPTEFSNYIKQRAMQQQQQHLHHVHAPATAPVQGNHYAALSPRSLSPNSLSLSMGQSGDPFYFPSSISPMGMYPQYNGHRNIFDSQYHPDSNGPLYPAGHGKFNSYLDPNGFYGLGSSHHIQQQLSPNSMGAEISDCDAGNHNNLNNNNNNNNNNNSSSSSSNSKNNTTTITVTVSSAESATVSSTASPVPSLSAGTSVTSSAGSSPPSPSNTAAAAASAAAAAVAAAAVAATSSSSSQSDSKMIDGLNSFYSNATGSYQQLLVAN